MKSSVPPTPDVSQHELDPQQSASPSRQHGQSRRAFKSIPKPQPIRDKNRETPAAYRTRLIQQMRAELSRSCKEAGAGFPASRLEGILHFELDENRERGNWPGRMDFLLSCLGYAVGLGNVWRFPYLCFVNGGGAFLIPYTIFLFLCGIPVFLLELSLGQFTSEGPATCWEFAPIFTGVGYAMTYLSIIVAIYYNMIISYAIYYVFASMTSTLPWSNCNNGWNTDKCRYRLPVVECELADRQLNGTCYNGTKFVGIFNESLFNQMTKIYRVLPAEEYFYHNVLKLSSSINRIGTPDWKLVLCLLASWIIVFLCLVQGIKSFGKVVYFTALFPYVVLLVMFFRGVTLSNAGEGIKFYMVPDFSRLTSLNVWKDAAGQIFFSLSCSWGGLMSLSSYNRFHNNVIRDTFIVTAANSATSVFAGFVIFSFIGHLAGELKVPVKDVTASGLGLVFVIYPEAMNCLPDSNLWSILFFLMLLTLGVDSQFAMVETSITTFSDAFQFSRRHKPILVCLISVTLFLLGLPLTCPGGLYYMKILDTYCGSSILLLGFLECIAISWVYGRPGFQGFFRFSEDVGLMMHRPIWSGWRYLWQYISPAIILGIFLFNLVRYNRTEYKKNSGDYFPIWADALGWLISLISIFIILGTGLVRLLLEPADMPWRLRLFNLSIPSYKWGPALPRHRNLMAPYMLQLGVLRHFYLCPSRLIKYSEVFPVVPEELQGAQLIVNRSCSSDEPHNNSGTVADLG